MSRNFTYMLKYMCMYKNVQMYFFRAKNISLSIANYELVRKRTTEKFNGFIIPLGSLEESEREKC